MTLSLPAQSSFSDGPSRSTTETIPGTDQAEAAGSTLMPDDVITDGARRAAGQQWVGAACHDHAAFREAWNALANNKATQEHLAVLRAVGCWPAPKEGHHQRLHHHYYASGHRSMASDQ